MIMKSLFKRAPILALALALPMLASAQQWPGKPIHLIVPYPPGGNVDQAARAISGKLQEALGQPIIIENKAGAGGMIGGEYVAKAAPDGYTLFVAANGPLLFSPLIFNRAAYNWQKDFVTIGSISFTPMVLQVHPSVPATTLEEFFDAAKKNPGKITMASPGAGTTNHLASELLQMTTGAQWTTVHYKGNAPATTDLLGGQVQFNFDQISVALPFIKDRRVRPLAVTSLTRVPSLPDVPTFDESGFKGFEATTFTGLFAPAGTPKDVIAKLASALARAVQDKDVAAKFAQQGAEARASPPDAFFEYLKVEDTKWTPVIRRANIKAD
ncbi:MAG: tripartite tricarboxylate transporter substrate binding protein [Betaproteobacteria bacterium]